MLRSVKQNLILIFCIAFLIVIITILSTSDSPRTAKDCVAAVGNPASHSTRAPRAVATNRRPSCNVLGEFSRVNFFDQNVASEICQGDHGFRRVNGVYGPCILRRPFAPSLLTEVLSASRWTYYVGLRGQKLPAMVMRSGEGGSEIFSRAHEWEMELVKKLTAVVELFPNTTFLDVGVNLGTYTIPMAVHGVRTISLDANLRLVVRVLLSLMVNGVDADQSQLLWNIVSNQESELGYLKFAWGCDLISASSTGKYKLKDSIPVMPMASSRLASMIHTRNVVLKIDVEGSEAGFFLTSGSLFEDFNFIVVQMEWREDLLGKTHMREIFNFLTRRSYVPLLGYTWADLTAEDYLLWNKLHGFSIEVLWVRQEYIQQVMGARM